MGKHLSERQFQDYERTGCIFPLTIMSMEEARQHRMRLEGAEAEHGNMHYLVKPYLVLSSAAEIGRNPILLDAVEDILGPDILMWDSAYVIKEPHDDRYVSWHQDLTYWGLSSDRLVTAWLALTISNAQNGCMKFIPGSHRDGKIEHRDTYAADNILHRGQELAVAIDETKAVDIVLEPGQASLHHGWAFHASNPNPSNDRRIGLTIQYVVPSVRQMVASNESATLVRGVDNYGHFQPEPRCESDFEPEGVEFQEKVQALKHAVYDKA
jgi:ectoine hydroxylase-related dioxygenase (phytanoyl-CoA dioxygenase family)